MQPGTPRYKYIGGLLSLTVDYNESSGGAPSFQPILFEEISMTEGDGKLHNLDCYLKLSSFSLASSL